MIHVHYLIIIAKLKNKAIIVKILFIYNFPAKFATHEPEAEFKLNPVLHEVHEDPEVLL